LEYFGLKQARAGGDEEMYCSNCGAQLSDAAAFCSKCGSPTASRQGQYTQGNTYQQYTPPPYQQNVNKINTMALVGFIVACASLLLNLWGIVGIAGLALSIVGFVQIKNTGENGKGFAIAGIVIGGVSVLYGFYTIVAAASFLNWILY